MSEITIGLDWREIDAQAIQRDLTARFHGRWAWARVGLTALGAAALVFLALDAVLPAAELGSTSTLAVLFGVLVFLLGAQRLQRALVRAVLAAPVRREATEVSLDAAGIAAPGALIAGRLPWRWVVEVVDGDAALLVLFSPIEFIPLADAKLPEGLTRAALKAQIETWRAAAKREAAT